MPIEGRNWKYLDNGPVRSGPDTDIEANRALVLEFYGRFVAEADYSSEASLVHPSYRQHSTMAADGVEGVKAMIDYSVKEWPDRRVTFHRTIAEGNMVVVHTHLVRWPGDLGLIALDIFRVEDGKVAEHWDVIQEVPAKLPHERGMF